MHRTKTLAALMLAAALSAVPQTRPAPGFTGEGALAFTRQIAALGPRTSGSDAMRKLQAYILGELKRDKCQVIEDDFRASTPLGPIPMKNIVARFPGTSGRMLVVTGHYDTKSMPGTYFLGANDGGASAGFLLEMARALSGRPHKDDIYLVWLDGEEAIAQWSDTDGTYGSRHLAAKWESDGTLRRVKALINVDMIGDRNLGILYETNSSPELLKMVWTTAAELGLGRYFLSEGGPIEDDHIPFRRRGVAALDLIDFDYGPQNAYWHTDKDTVDKLSARSLEVVGRVVLAALKKLE